MNAETHSTSAETVNLNDVTSCLRFLGVSDVVTADELNQIKKAAARANHPDSSSEPNEELLKNVNAAIDTLKKELLGERYGSNVEGQDDEALSPLDRLKQRAARADVSDVFDHEVAWMHFRDGDEETELRNIEQTIQEAIQIKDIKKTVADEDLGSFFDTTFIDLLDMAPVRKGEERQSKVEMYQEAMENARMTKQKAQERQKQVQEQVAAREAAAAARYHEEAVQKQVEIDSKVKEIYDLKLAAVSGENRRDRSRIGRNINRLNNDLKRKRGRLHSFVKKHNIKLPEPTAESVTSTNDGVEGRFVAESIDDTSDFLGEVSDDFEFSGNETEREELAAEAGDSNEAAVRRAEIKEEIRILELKIADLGEDMEDFKYEGRNAKELARKNGEDPDLLYKNAVGNFNKLKEERQFLNDQRLDLRDELRAMGV